MTSLEFKRVNDAIRVWNNMGFEVDVGINYYILMCGDKEQDHFKDSRELYTAAVYYQQGYFHAQLDGKIEND